LNGVREYCAQESLELFRSHSVALHSKVLVSVALVAHVVRRVCKDKVCGCGAGHQPLNIGSDRRIAAE
jgi:hypothetical protein